MNDSQPPRLRILHVIPSLGMGGAPRGVVELVTRLGQDNSLDLYLCSLGHENETFSWPLPRPVIYLGYLFSLRDLFGTFRCLLDLRQQMRSLKIDVLHTHLMPAHFIGALANLRLRIPQVVHIRGTPTWLQSNRLRDVIRRTAFSVLLCRENIHFVAVSKGAADYVGVNLRLNRDKMRVVTNGIDLSEFSGDGVIPNSTTRPELVIGSAGRFCPEKGHIVLIKSLAILRSRGVSAGLLLAGAGGLEEEYRRWVNDFHLGDAVVFLGTVQDMPKFYRSLDIFVLPSLSDEGLPRVLMESMAVGTPVIASDVCGVRELIKDEENGLIVSPGNSEECADAIMRLCSDSGLKKQLALNGLNTVRQYYSADRVSDEIRNVYTVALMCSKQPTDGSRASVRSLEER
jgi:glycosyltransferase involved in cell wall biosynthesis